MVGVPLVLIVLSPLVGFFSSPLVWILGFVMGYWLPKFWLGRRKSKRLKAFNSNLADTIMLLANSLRAGSSFLQAVEMIVRETQPPISTEFGRVIREVNLGLPLDDALGNLSRRVRSDDLDLMTTAIAIHHTVGGNLAEILDSIAYTIRERVRIKGEIKTLTAQHVCRAMSSASYRSPWSCCYLSSHPRSWSQCCRSRPSCWACPRACSCSVLAD